MTKTCKRCEKCGETKDTTMFYKRTAASDGLQNRCKPCQHKDSGLRAKTTRYAVTDAEKKRRAIRHREYQRANPEKVRGYVMSWRLRNLDQWKAYWTKRQKQEVEELADRYVRTQLSLRSPLSPSQFPDELVKLKRQQMLLSRAIKSMEVPNEKR